MQAIHPYGSLRQNYLAVDLCLPLQVHYWHSLQQPSRLGDRLGVEAKPPRRLKIIAAVPVLLESVLRGNGYLIIFWPYTVQESEGALTFVDQNYSQRQIEYCEI